MITPGTAPEGAYVPGTDFGQDYQGMSVETAKAQLATPFENVFGNLGDLLADTLNGILTAVVNGIVAGAQAVGMLVTGVIDTITGAIQWVTEGIAALFGVGGEGMFQENSPLREVYDGQMEIQERFDLMDDVSGFAVAYLPYNYLQGASSSTYYTAPFNNRLGPEKNATVNGDGEITLAKGTWHINCQMTTDTNDNNNNLFLRLEVLRPDGTVYSYKDVTHRITPGSDTTLQVFHPVVCPADNYRVRAQFRIWPGSVLKTRVYGGVTSSHLAVNRLDISTENAVPAGTVPNGPDIN